MFILPVNVTADIERLMRDFLWSNGEFKRGKAKVNWADVCRPKAPLDACWSLRKILHIRSSVAGFIVKQLGNGTSTSAWYDNWLPCGPIGNIISYRDLYEANFSKKEVVSDIVGNDVWNVPNEWLDKYRIIFDNDPPILVNNKDDVCKWRTMYAKLTSFSVKVAWQDLCDEWVDVKWAKLVWFSQCVPRHSFITWVALHSKLKTPDKYIVVNHQFAQGCPFCLTQKASHNHLFFKCDYPKGVWNYFKMLGNLDFAPDEWYGIIEFLEKRPINKSIWSIIQRLILGACVYYVWQEINLRLFQNKSRPMNDLVKIIKKTIMLKLAGLTIKKSRQTKPTFELWNLKENGDFGLNLNDD
ncbi:uncharacterized protein [Rutidosis leptorrhynchoides]|uniref:uncharacterized protein n=1 Tax=Rutidosis leptorrhynchoides TaxID=125765 RepID=UPI003A9A474A